VDGLHCADELFTKIHSLTVLVQFTYYTSTNNSCMQPWAVSQSAPAPQMPLQKKF